MNFQPSHFIAFTSIIQLAVALNFGLVYLDRRSGLLRLKRRLFNNYKAGDTLVVGRVSKVLKRYRNNNEYTPEIERAHTKAKQYYTIVTADWDDEHEISFFPSIGIIYGIYSLALLFIVGFFDVHENLCFYHNLFLFLSQITLLFSILLIFRSWRRGTVTRIIPSTLIYLCLLIVGGLCCWKGCFFEGVKNFSRHYHWYVFMTYLPIIYYFLRILLIYCRKSLYIFPMVWWASKFEAALDDFQD